MLIGRADPVDLVRDGLQPGPAVFVGQGVAGAHLGDVAGGVKLVAILVSPADPFASVSPIVVLPEPDTPIGISAHGISAVSLSTKILPSATLVHEPDGLAYGMGAIRRQVLAAKRRDKIARFSAPDTSNSISRQEPSTGKVSVTRGTNGSTWLRDADHPAFGFIRGGIAGKQRGGMAVGADAHQHGSRTGAMRSPAGRRRKRISDRPHSAAPFRPARRVGRNGVDVDAGAQASRKMCRAIPMLFSGSSAGTKRSSPMNQCTRSQGIRLR